MLGQSDGYRRLLRHAPKGIVSRRLGRRAACWHVWVCRHGFLAEGGCMPHRCQRCGELYEEALR